MLQSNTTALLNYDFKQLLRKWKDEINGCCRYPNFGLMLPSSNKKRLFWNIYQCPYGFSWFATSTLSFLDTPPGNVTGHFMSTNNFLVALPDFAQTLPTYYGSQIWKVLLFSSSKLNWLRKQAKGCIENFTLERLLPSEICTCEICEVCLQTFRHNKICSKLTHFLRNLQTSQANKTRELLGLGTWNFRGIVFIWTPAYREIFKSALVYF